MTNKIENLIKKRLNNLSRQAYKLLNICSLFYVEFGIDMLTEITDKNGIELMDSIDELLLKDILKEEVDGDEKVSLSFSHRKIREYVYNNMSSSKKLILHGKVVEYYESRLLSNKKVNRTRYT